MEKPLLALLGCLPAVTPLRAEPSPPMGLLRLYAKSQTVVSGKVIRLQETRPGEDFSGKRVTLKVSSVLKGPLVGSEVVIQTGSTELCPPDGTYEEGETYLAFRWGKDGKKFWTTGLEYGAKRLNDGDEFAYRARLQELEQVLALPNGNVDDPRGPDGDLDEPYGVRDWKYLSLPQVDQVAELLVRIPPNTCANVRRIEPRARGLIGCRSIDSRSSGPADGRKGP